MSQSYKECLQGLFCICCKDVGLDCNCTIYGINEETVIDNAILYLCENYAIEPEEVSTCMRLKIIENVSVTVLPQRGLDGLMVSLLSTIGAYANTMYNYGTGSYSVYIPKQVQVM